MKTVFALLILMGVVGGVRGQYWEPLGGGVKGFGNIAALQVDTFHNVLYVGGSFDSIGNIKAQDLTVWDGSHYIKLSHEPIGITDLTMKHDTLIYLSGGFNGSKIGMYVDTS